MKTERFALPTESYEKFSHNTIPFESLTNKLGSGTCTSVLCDTIFSKHIIGIGCLQTDSIMVL